MILLDANLLIYAYLPSSPHHAATRSWLEGRFEREPHIGLPWVTILAFLRIVTNANLPSPATFADASGVIEDLLALPNTRLVHPGERHWSILKQMGGDVQARGPLITDLHLAALAIEYGAVLCSNDAGFRRFPGLQYHNPLV